MQKLLRYEEMLLWFPLALKNLNNLMRSRFDAFQVLCQNPLLVRTSLLCFSPAANEERKHGQIKWTTSVKEETEKKDEPNVERYSFVSQFSLKCAPFVSSRQHRAPLVKHPHHQLSNLWSKYCSILLQELWKGPKNSWSWFKICKISWR